MESDSENEFVDATEFIESNTALSGSKGIITKPVTPVSPEPVPPPRAKKKEKLDNSPIVTSNRHNIPSDRVCDSKQDHMRNEQDHVINKECDADHMISGQDHVVTKDHHDKDHMISGQDHVRSEKQNQVTSKHSEKDQINCEKSTEDCVMPEDHVMPDVSKNTMYFEAKSRTSLVGDSNDVTDGGNGYDVQKELDEILSNSDLIDGTHLNLPTQIMTTTTAATTAASTAAASTTTTTHAVNTSSVDTSTVVTETSTSLTKSDHTQSSPSTNSKSDAVASASPMSDSQILDLTMVKNLDTGEVVSLKIAQEQITQGINPLSLHLMHRTSEFVGNSCSPVEKSLSPSGSTELLDSATHLDSETSPKRGRKRGMSKRFKHLFVKSSSNQKSVDSKDGNTISASSSPSNDSESPLELNPQPQVKYKQSSHYKGSVDFDNVRLKQDLTESHMDAIWAMRFSVCGRLLATAGQDKTLYVWVLRSAYRFFYELQLKYARLGSHPSYDSLSSSSNSHPSTEFITEEDLPKEDPSKPFCEHPICQYKGHKADILDICWSKNFFLLSASMDKTVRLWHVSRKECLCCFQHVDFVTAIAFHPRDDRYFLSGSLDGKLRLWNIPDKKVALWNEISDGSTLITAANFCQNGKKAVVGTYDGRCLFFDTEHLKYHTQIHVRSRRGKNSHGSKISGIEPLPGEDKLLITSNDSRVRLYNLRDLTLACKYKGCINTSSQIKASFSHDGRYVICGSEDHCVYIWKTFPEVTKFSSTRRDRNENYESFTAHSSVVTAAVFAPVPGFFVGEGLKDVGQVLVAADYSGAIKVYINCSDS